MFYHKPKQKNEKPDPSISATGLLQFPQNLRNRPNSVDGSDTLVEDEGSVGLPMVEPLSTKEQEKVDAWEEIEQ